MVLSYMPLSSRTDSLLTKEVTSEITLVTVTCITKERGLRYELIITCPAEIDYRLRTYIHSIQLF